MAHLGLRRSVSLEIELLVIYIFVHSDHLNQSLKMFVRLSAWPHEELLYKKKNGRKSQHSLEMQLQEGLSHLQRGKPTDPHLLPSCLGCTQGAVCLIFTYPSQ